MLTIPGIKLAAKQKSRQTESAPGVGNGASSQSSTSGDLSIFSSPISGTSSCQILPDPASDTQFIILQGGRTWEAYLTIAGILKLACQQDSGFNICALIDTLPPTLAPTPQQQLIPHKPYVDMLPWPSLRDRILSSILTINEAEFVRCLYDFKVWGCIPWDPCGWEVGSEFAEKWWFLLDDGILRTTNFWRSQRGEHPLVLAPPRITQCD